MLYYKISNEIENDWLKINDVITDCDNLKTVELKLSHEKLVTGMKNQLLCIVPSKTKSKWKKN